MTKDALHTQLTGGCACGAVRYRLASKPFDAGYCHCRICQRSSGAPVMAFATVPLTDFVFTQGAPARRRSSEFGQRSFCSACGSQVTMQVEHQADTIDFSLATLDDPNSVAPEFHIWTGNQIAWLGMLDNLPRYSAFRPDTPGLRPWRDEQ